MQVVEKFLKQPHMQHGRRIDVFGFGDVIACRAADDRLPAVIALVQTCAGSSHANRRRKILGTLPMKGLKKKERIAARLVAERASYWKKCGGTIWLISWVKRDGRWQAKEEVL